MKKYRAMLIDDHAGYRRFLRKCLDRHPFIEVVGESGSAEEAWTEIPRLNPDLLTVDIRLPGQNGFELARKVKDRYPGMEVVFISFNGNPAFRKTAGEMSCPYLTKDNLLEDLSPVLEALQNCLALAGEEKECRRRSKPDNKYCSSKSGWTLELTRIIHEK